MQTTAKDSLELPEGEEARKGGREGEEEGSQHSFVHKWTSLPSSSSAASRKHQMLSLGLKKHRH